MWLQLKHLSYISKLGYLLIPAEAGLRVKDFSYIWLFRIGWGEEQLNLFVDVKRAFQMSIQQHQHHQLKLHRLRVLGVLPLCSPLLLPMNHGQSASSVQPVVQKNQQIVSMPITKIGKSDVFSFNTTFVHFHTLATCC